MHPRNKYKHKKPDFIELAKYRPALQPYLIFKGPDYATINFQDPSALRELACALLECDFNLKLEIPLDRLIPTIPLRLNYVHWIEDLLMTDDGSVPSGNGIHGIDIGTGASCIYPLLCARLDGWHFTATEIDPVSVRYATKNIHDNDFSTSITVLQVDSDVVLDGIVDENTNYDFCMCNPPFFQDSMDRDGDTSNRTGTRPSPPNPSTSKIADHETVTKGGEVQFVSRILADSLKLRTKIRWYTSMLGKKSSIKELLKQLKHHQVPVITTTEFVQGRTHRWGIAWSFFESEKSKAGASSSGNKKETVYAMKLPDVFTSHDQVKDWITQQLNNLQVEWSLATDKEECQSLMCRAVKKTWTNQRRKRRLAAAQHQQTTPKRPKESMELGKVDNDKDEQMQDDVPVVSQEISTASCNLDFTCVLHKMDDVNSVQFKWLHGDSKDNLHQITQYLKNQAQLCIQTSANGK